jgi:hypothetical protein
LSRCIVEASEKASKSAIFLPTGLNKYDIFNDSTEVAFVGQNLLDDDHFEFGADQTVNRQFLLTLRREF